MSIPISPNATCVIYRSGNAPPAAPDVAALRCHLTAGYSRGLEHGEGDQAKFKYTHTLLVDLATDVRDDYSVGSLGTNMDTVYVPDQGGTGFRVVFVERRHQGTPQDHKKVYLVRLVPTWPTPEL